MTSREKATIIFQKYETKFKKRVMKKRSKNYFIRKKHVKILFGLIKELV